jgi:putative redox protein
MEERTMPVALPGGAVVEAHYKGFNIRTDQPVYSGGTGTAPAPFDLFLASIATCAGYYVLAFCQERKIATEGISIVMKMDKNQETKKLEQIAIEISLPRSFPVKYKNVVIRAVDQCAVKRYIINPPAFSITAEIQPQ